MVLFVFTYFVILENLSILDLALSGVNRLIVLESSKRFTSTTELSEATSSACMTTNFTQCVIRPKRQQTQHLNQWRTECYIITSFLPARYGVIESCDFIVSFTGLFILFFFFFIWNASARNNSF